MHKIILRMAIEKADDSFKATELYKDICNYIGEKVVPPDVISVFEYAQNRRRNYRSCKSVAARYDLGTMANGKRFLDKNDVAFLDSTERKHK